MKTMLGLVGKKIGMTRLYDAKGAVRPVTVIEAGPCTVLQIKQIATDGYTALQLGFGDMPERKVRRPMAGHFKKAGSTPKRVVREFRLDDTSAYEVGAALDVSIFEEGERVDVIGISKGRGFAGSMKRNNASRGPETHGSRHHRRPGSLGMSATPSHVFKGKKLPGHMGAATVTVQNLRVIKVDTERNLLVLNGAVPGHNDGYVMVAKSKKAAKKAARKKK